MAVPGEDTSNEWLEKVSEEDYLAAQPLSE